jgi:hypothetical protein
MRPLVTLAALLAAAAPAVAQPVPPFASPQRDVDILYAMPVPNGPAGPPGPAAPPGLVAALTQRLRVQAATGLQRIDPPSPGTYMVTDGRTGRMTVIQPAEHLATRVPSVGGRVPPPGQRATGSYVDAGRETIAGELCTDWRTRDATGQDSLVCLTDDGMMLRIVQQGQLRAQAIKVARVPQPDPVFAIPPGFRIEQAK